MNRESWTVTELPGKPVSGTMSAAGSTLRSRPAKSSSAELSDDSPQWGVMAKAKTSKARSPGVRNLKLPPFLPGECNAATRDGNGPEGQGCAGSRVETMNKPYCRQVPGAIRGSRNSPTNVRFVPEKRTNSSLCKSCQSSNLSGFAFQEFAQLQRQG